jgi:hypothetical protein
LRNINFSEAFRLYHAVSHTLFRERKMAGPTYSFAEARDAFVKALNDYQRATLDMSLALKRMTDHNVEVCSSLHRIIHGALPARAKR